MTSEIRLGVVGGGVYGTQMLKCFAAQQNMGRMKLVALTDLDQKLLDQHENKFGLKGYTDFQTMLDDAQLDAVAVATPDHLHARIITAAAEKGIHVISQKPLDTDVDRTRNLIELCRRAGIILYVDFHKRFDPAHLRLRNDIRDGKFGRLHYGSVHMEDRIEVPTLWLKSWAASSSPSWFLGVHFYDLVNWITGSAPVRVLASGNKGKLESMGLAGAWDSIQAKVEYEDGLSVNYDLSWILPDSFPSIVNQGIRLVGEKGIAEVDSQDRGYFSAYEQNSGSEVVNPYGAMEQSSELFGSTTDGYTFTSMSWFVDMLLAHKSGKNVEELKGHYPDGESALVSTQIGEAVERSLDSGSIELIT